ncbi:TetR/AcrR family transcriptional regulator [Actinocorallia populi]|uniref:TetR/AcrR family transcriptional regulator n=1 Tax=Actinocorallia populi TaxID=2079200 RepID=UPI000D09429A|nr:TetR/AcrR family transcriptional regulator [Actinocorallia populi]
MSASDSSGARPAAARRGRRGGRPTLEEAAELDRAVRDCALRLFLEHGYEGTSMDAIARAAGTTKASLYTRFGGKEELFRAVLGQAVTDAVRADPEPLDPDDLEGALTAIARAALRHALDPVMVRLARIAATQAGRFPEPPRQVFLPRRRLLVELLERHAATGAITADEPEILAEHFFAMVSGMPARLASFGHLRDPATQEHHMEVAVRLFLRGLRPD